MKLFTTLGVFLMFCAICYPQIHIETEYREYCYWNDYTEKYDDCEGYEEFTTFDVAEDWTYWVHTTPTIQSTYYVIESKYMEDYDLTFYYVESDAGNEYIYVFDVMRDEIRIFGTDRNGDPYILTFYVKSWE